MRILFIGAHTTHSCGHYQRYSISYSNVPSCGIWMLSHLRKRSSLELRGTVVQGEKWASFSKTRGLRLRKPGDFPERNVTSDDPSMTSKSARHPLPVHRTRHVQYAKVSCMHERTCCRKHSKHSLHSIATVYSSCCSTLSLPAVTREGGNNRCEWMSSSKTEMLIFFVHLGAAECLGLMG